MTSTFSEDLPENPKAGDIHYSVNGVTSGSTLVFNGTDWITTTTTTGTGGSTSIFSAPPPPPLRLYEPEEVDTVNPFDKEFNGMLPNRDVYVAQQLYEHLKSNRKAIGSGGGGICGCGHKYAGKTSYVLHIAEESIKASDLWDESVMDGDDESEDDD